MKATGIVRNIDALGRLVIAKELRTTMGISEQDPMEFYVDGDKIILKKYQPGCYICQSIEDNLTQFHGRMICNKCISEVGQVAERLAVSK